MSMAIISGWILGNFFYSCFCPIPTELPSFYWYNNPGAWKNFFINWFHKHQNTHESIYKMCLSRSRSVKINQIQKHCVYWGLCQWKVSWVHEDPMKERWNEATFRRRQYRQAACDGCDWPGRGLPHIIHYTLHYACQGNKRSSVAFSVKPPPVRGPGYGTQRSFVWMLPYKPKWCWQFTTF